MNKPEKKALLLFLFLFGIGFLIRLLPIEPVPAIEEFSVEEKVSLQKMDPELEKKVELEPQKSISSPKKSKKRT